jgi:hypothetical protein
MEIIVSPGIEVEVDVSQRTNFDEGDHIPCPEAEGDHATNTLNGKEKIFLFSQCGVNCL